MRSLRLRVAVALVLTGLAAVASPRWLYQPRMDRGAARAARLPLVVDGWMGQELPVDEHTRRVLETDDLILRQYDPPDPAGTAVQLAVVFSPDNRRVAHPPEVCYRGAGWEPIERRIVALDGLPPMVRLVLAHGPLRDVVLYCYLAGDTLTADYRRQQVQIVLNTLRRRATSSALIRFSTPLRNDEPLTQAQARLAELARRLMPQIVQTLSGAHAP